LTISVLLFFLVHLVLFVRSIHTAVICKHQLACNFGHWLEIKKAVTAIRGVGERKGGGVQSRDINVYTR